MGITPDDRIRFLNSLSLPAPKNIGLQAKALDLQSGQDTAFVDAGCITSFAAGVSDAHRQAILDSMLFAQLASGDTTIRSSQPDQWYLQYRKVLGNIGWVLPQWNESVYQTNNAGFTADEVILDVLGAMLTQNELAIINSAITALKSLANSDKQIVIFSENSYTSQQGNFQVAVASEVGGAVSLKMGFFYFTTQMKVTKILFFTFTNTTTSFMKEAEQLTLDEAAYNTVAQTVSNRLANLRQSYVANLPLPGA